MPLVHAYVGMYILSKYIHNHQILSKSADETHRCYEIQDQGTKKEILQKK